MSAKRITRSEIPTTPTICKKTLCVYNASQFIGGNIPGDCENPRLNFENSDAECFGKPPRKVLEYLGLVGE